MTALIAATRSSSGKGGRPIRQTTRELRAYIANAKGLDMRGAVMRKVICRKIIHMLRRLALQGNLLIDGERQAQLFGGCQPRRKLYFEGGCQLMGWMAP